MINYHISSIITYDLPWRTQCRFDAGMDHTPLVSQCGRICSRGKLSALTLMTPRKAEKKAGFFIMRFCVPSVKKIKG